MFHLLRTRVSFPSLLLVVFGFTVTARAQIPVNGIADQGIYTASVSFSVPTSAGHSYLVLLDEKPVLAGFTNQVTQADYHELLVTRTNMTTLEVTNRLIRFIVRASDRGDTETGLPPWVPYPSIPSSTAELAGAHIDLIAPDTFPQGLEIPIVAWVRNAQNGVVRANGQLAATGHPSITMRRGVGSGLLAANNPAGALTYAAQLAGVQATKGILIEASTTWTSVSGTLAGNTVWGEDSRIAVTGSITIPAGSTLTIHEGSVVRLNSGVNITNLGRISIEGLASRPVVFTPVTRAQPWGGFFLTAATSQFDAVGAIFVAPCAQQSGYPGHRGEQPLLYIDNRARAAMTNCAAIYLAGQFQHSIDRGTPYATVTVVDSLIQRCTTAGEFNGCSLTFLNSALLEIPNEDQFYCANPDCDHDGFYLNAGIHEIRDSLVGWLKDDCFDAGSGGGPSSVVVSNCWVEGAFHEGLAWSGGGRVTRTYDSVLINNGQGIECGWSSGANSPVVYGTRLLSLANAVGARYGDNYTGTSGLGLKNGTLIVTNSFLLHNLRDVFGRAWDDTWNWRVNNMDVRDNLLTAPNSFHPGNTAWNPAADAWKLASFMTTPPGAAVGVGIATWGSQLSMAELFQGVPVRLSSFTTNTVSVSYTFGNGALALGSGTLTFAPGETVKRIFPSGFDVSASNPLKLILGGAVGGELTGLTEVAFQGNVPAAQVSIRAIGSQIDLARVVEGVPVGLNTPSALSVSIDYEFATATATLAGGTLTFAPGQTLAWAPAPGVNPQDHEFLQFALSNPTNAQLVNPSVAYLVKTAVAPLPPSVTLIPRGAVWRYRDVASAAPAGWQAPGFDDDTWPAGPAQLGFSNGEENDEATLIADNDQITSYFRHTVSAADPPTFASLSLWMLRDDGGVVYLNGTEIFRSPNLPAPPAAISYTTTTGSPNGENTIDTATTNRNALRAGANVLAVEIHQQSATSSDVSFNFELIGNPVPPPPPPQEIYLATFGNQLTLGWGDPSFSCSGQDKVTGLDQRADSGVRSSSCRVGNRNLPAEKALASARHLLLPSTGRRPGGRENRMLLENDRASIELRAPHPDFPSHKSSPPNVRTALTACSRSQ